MNYLKSNAMPLVIGAVVGFYLARHGGVGAVVSKVKSAA
jgi:hypothetical protein